MAKFISSTKGLSIYVTVNGKRKAINFACKSQGDDFGTFITINRNVIDALKKSHFFGKYYTLAEDDEELNAEEDAPVKQEFSAVYENVKRTQEANRILISQYGVDKDSLKSKEDALAAAIKLNISFPNL